ncbi:hypothetical protein NKG05_00060 [Oerskovia sp. M15]
MTSSPHDPHVGHDHGSVPADGPGRDDEASPVGKALPPSSGFSGDDGSADPELTAVLAGFVAGTAGLTGWLRSSAARAC